MRKLQKIVMAALCMALLLCLTAPAQAMECTAKEGWPFFLSESDLDLFTEISNAKDSEAAARMATEGRVWYFKAGVKVFREGGFAVCKFRVPGSTVHAYTYCEALKCR